MRKRAELDAMEKIDVTKEFRKAEGDFIPIPGSFTVDGWDTVQTKKGAAQTVRFQREDGLSITLFADQLRKEGDKFLVSVAHFNSQLARAEEWAVKKGTAPKK